MNAQINSNFLRCWTPSAQRFMPTLMLNLILMVHNWRSADRCATKNAIENNWSVVNPLFGYEVHMLSIKIKIINYKSYKSYCGKALIKVNYSDFQVECMWEEPWPLIGFGWRTAVGNSPKNILAFLYYLIQSWMSFWYVSDATKSLFLIFGSDTRTIAISSFCKRIALWLTIYVMVHENGLLFIITMDHTQLWNGLLFVRIQPGAVHGVQLMVQFKLLHSIFRSMLIIIWQHCTIQLCVIKMIGFIDGQRRTRCDISIW